MRFNFGQWFPGEPENGIQSGWNFLEIEHYPAIKITMVEDYDQFNLSIPEATEAVQDRWGQFFEDKEEDIMAILEELKEYQQAV